MKKIRENFRMSCCTWKFDVQGKPKKKSHDVLLHLERVIFLIFSMATNWILNIGAFLHGAPPFFCIYNIICTTDVTSKFDMSNRVIHCHFDVLTINVIGNQQSIYSSCKSPYIQIILRLQQKTEMRGRRKTTCQGIIVTYTERQIQHMSVPEGTLHSSTGLAMGGGITSRWGARCWLRWPDPHLSSRPQHLQVDCCLARRSSSLKILAATITIENPSNGRSHTIR
jgi:hypothetical protein